ncbi:MAG: hypothetical protein ACSHYB_19320 [Roseibacillus sp.]
MYTNYYNASLHIKNGANRNYRDRVGFFVLLVLVLIFLANLAADEAIIPRDETKLTSRITIAFGSCM